MDISTDLILQYIADRIAANEQLGEDSISASFCISELKALQTYIRYLQGCEADNQYKYICEKHDFLNDFAA
jgi:hypothetical protein